MTEPTLLDSGVSVVRPPATPARTGPFTPRRAALAALITLAAGLALTACPPGGATTARAPAVGTAPSLAGATGTAPASSVPLAVAATDGLTASPADLRLAVPATVTVPGTTAALPWPSAGQAVLAVRGVGVVGRSGAPTRPVPIASVAKVMTAYVILRDHPLAAGVGGPTITVTAAEAAAYPAQRAARQSLVKVAAGERLTLRQALQALLIASADNVAQILARWDAGSPQAFVAEMNRTAAELGMTHTRYTDPSGLDAGTVSTAADQLLLAEEALEQPALTEVAAQPSAVIPVAGTIRNYNTLLGRYGIDGIKTGSTNAAGGCLLFSADQTLGGRRATVVGAVLGQPGTAATILPNALNAAAALVRAVPRTVRTTVLVHAGDVVASGTGGDGRTVGYTVRADVTALAWPGVGFGLRLDTSGDGPRLVVHDPRTGTDTPTALVPHP